MEGKIKKIDLTFSQRLEKIMIEQQLFPAQLSKLSGVSRTNIHKYLAGTIQPTAFNIKRISVALNVSADYLLGIVDKK